MEFPQPADRPDAGPARAASRSMREYLEFRDEIDLLVSGLVERHRAALACRRGCASCCTAIFIPALEISLLRQLLAESALRLPEKRSASAGRCGFLVDGACSIYPHRPVICRVHGLPLAYPVETWGADGRRVESDERSTTWCELNFREEGAAPERPRRFTRNESVDMAWIESRLTGREPEKESLDRLADEFRSTS